MSLRQKVSRVGLVVMILGLILYFYVVSHEPHKKQQKAPPPWRTPQRASAMVRLSEEV